MLKIGHRGAKGHVIENTLDSFQKAIDLHCDAVELDVHKCKSGEIVVFHDFVLDKLTNLKGNVSDFTLTELKQAFVHKKHTIPTLKEVLNLLDGKCIVNIELKGKNTAQPVVELLNKTVQITHWQPNNFIISSFDEDEILTCLHLKSNYLLGIIVQNNFTEAFNFAQKHNLYSIHAHFNLLTNDNCKFAKENKFKIFAWTVNDFKDIEKVKNLAIDGIISDFPDRL
jgi:glycerophosphoryl diester phosphodiesterase